MVRTVIALPDDDKQWLDREARRRGVPMTELVREAVRSLRERSATELGLDGLLDATAGSWSGPDPLEYQRARRDEW